MLKYCEFDCSHCGHTYDDLIEKETGVFPFEPVLACPVCNVDNTPLLGSNIAAFSAKSREDQVASLKKRSRDHSKKMMKKNADEIEHKWNGTAGAAKING